MEVVDGAAAEAIPLAKAELRILDARFKGDKYNALLAWLNTPAELASGLPESTGKEFPGLVENHEEELVGATVFEAINPLRGVDGVLLAEAAAGSTRKEQLLELYVRLKAGLSHLLATYKDWQSSAANKE